MNWEIVHLPAKPHGPVETCTVDVLASKIDPMLANTLIKKLSQICTLENLRHVKRIQKRIIEGNAELSVIICLFDEYENYEDEMTKNIHQLISDYKLNPYKTKVAKYSATSKEEWEQQCKLWPTSFHPPNNLDGVACLSEEETQLIFSNMKLAIKLTQLSYICGKVSNASLIVDPLNQQIIATSVDQTCVSPAPYFKDNLDHVDVDRLVATVVSHANACGVSNNDKCLSSKFSHQESYNGVSCLNPWGWMEVKEKVNNQKHLVESERNCTWHPLKHAPMVAIENAAARDRKLFPGPESLEVKCVPNNTFLHSSDNSPAKRQKVQGDILCEEVSELPSESAKPYLCTGFDIYLVWEPCTMCAMALVHQRIRRIFFALPNPNAGALGSVHRLQGEKSLNHHYSVYRVMVPEAALHDVNLKDIDELKHG